MTSLHIKISLILNRLLPLTSAINWSSIYRCVEFITPEVSEKTCNLQNCIDPLSHDDHQMISLIWCERIGQNSEWGFDGILSSNQIVTSFHHLSYTKTWGAMQDSKSRRLFVVSMIRNKYTSIFHSMSGREKKVSTLKSKKDSCALAEHYQEINWLSEGRLFLQQSHFEDRRVVTTPQWKLEKWQVQRTNATVFLIICEKSLMISNEAKHHIEFTLFKTSKIKQILSSLKIVFQISVHSIFSIIDT